MKITELGEVHPFTCCSPALATNCERKNGTSEGILDKNMDCPCGFVKNNKDTVSGPQWRTGEIPQPDGPSVLVLERKQNITRGVSMFLADLTHDVLIWAVPNNFTPSGLLKYFPESYTGRWCIQNINLPKK